MRITSDIECGNGKNIQEIVSGQFRMEEVGEEPPYCKYFCVRIESEGDGGRVRLDVYPDPLLGEPGRRDCYCFPLPCGPCPGRRDGGK